MVLNMLKNFRFAKFRFILTADEDISLPAYKGAVLRGGFGYVFKKMVCAQQFADSCSKCMLRNNCAYAYIFETPLPADAQKLRSYNAIPHPFVIEPPNDTVRIVRKGFDTEFNLALIGNAVDYLPYFVITFIELGKKGLGRNKSRYILKDVQSLDMAGKAISIFNSASGALAGDFTVLTGDMFESTDKGSADDQISLEFLTQCRIKFNEKFTCNIEFHILIRNMLRRLSTLSLFHCGNELEYDYKELIEKANSVKTIKNSLQWRDWERYSTRQKQKMALGGAIGSITYQGDLAPFLTLLKLGEYIHVGKGTSFGLGKYVINQ